MFQTKTTIKKLQESSQNALGAFNKIVTDLTNNNKQIEVETADRLTQISLLREEMEALENIAHSNQKVISKINKFLQDED